MNEIKIMFLGLAIASPVAFFLGCIGHMAYGDDSIYINIMGVLTGMSLYWVGKLLAKKLLRK